MKSYRGFPIFVWILLGLLAISAGIVSLGQRDVRAFPSAESTSPSGTAAFAEVLRRQGYRVDVDMRPRPALAPGDVAVAFVFRDGNPNERTDFLKGVHSAMEAGATVVTLPLSQEFDRNSAKSLKAEPWEVKPRGSTESLKIFGTSEVRNPEPGERDLEDDTLGAPSVGLWDDGSQQFLRASQIGRGRLLSLEDGLFATNRFIDRADDAKAALRLIQLVAPARGRVVFTESAFGNTYSPSLVETIGAWANAGWQQTLFLGLVVVYTLGKRFGIPDESRPPQRGARELLEALADTYLRGRQTKAAMTTTLARADTQIRTALRMARDADRGERDRQIPPELRDALARLQAAIEDERRTLPSDALDLVRAVRTRTDEFVGSRRMTRLTSS